MISYYTSEVIFLYQEILLAVIVSIDTFLAAAAYRSSDIKIPMISAFIISLTSAFVLGLSILLSDFIGQFIPPDICHITGFIVITSIGITTILKSLIRSLVRKLSERGELSLKSGSTGIVVKLYLDDTAADFDCSKVLSAAEAAALALASSLDSASTGLSCGFNEINPSISAVSAFISGFIAIILGSFFGKKISSMKCDFSWLGGIFLIGFAIFEFIK